MGGGQPASTLEQSTELTRTTTAGAPNMRVMGLKLKGWESGGSTLTQRLFWYKYCQLHPSPAHQVRFTNFPT